MYIYGNLKDKKIVDEITGIIKNEGLEGGVNFDSQSETYILWVKEAADLEKASDVFRVYIGGAKKFEIDPEWEKIKSIPFGVVSKVLVYFCVLLFGFNWALGEDQLFEYLMFSDKPSEFYKLLTPIFLHFNIIHILFNMLWLKDLGSMIEKMHGPKFFIFLVVFSGVFSNYLQFKVSGPNFGGMSGVVYALVGFLAVVKWKNKDTEYSIPKRDLYILIGWFFLCMTGIFGPIANWAHGGGLLSGALVGLLSKSAKPSKKA